MLNFTWQSPPSRAGLQTGLVIVLGTASLGFNAYVSFYTFITVFFCLTGKIKETYIC